MSLFTKDEDLPVWVHTLLLVLLCSTFAIPLLYLGIEGIITQKLDAFMGPEFGTYFIDKTLTGSRAITGGISLIFYGLSFYSIAYYFSHYYNEKLLGKIMPFILLGFSLFLSIIACKY